MYDPPTHRPRWLGLPRPAPAVLPPALRSEPTTAREAVATYARDRVQLAEMDENIANELMAKLDQNGDGEVDFEEFCNGWERIFIVGSHDSNETAKAAAGGDPETIDIGDGEEEQAAAATVQSHFRGHQERKEVAFRKQLRDQRADDRERHGDGEWDSARMDGEDGGGGGGRGSGGRGDDDYAQPLYELGEMCGSMQQELDDLDAGRRRQADQVTQAAALRRAQELELEAEAMAREQAYLGRMREGLVRRGMLGSASQDDRPTTAGGGEAGGTDEAEREEGSESRALEEFEAEVDAQISPGKRAKKAGKARMKAALSLDVGPLTTPTSELQADEMIRWGGQAGIRLVLQHNLRRVAEGNARNKSVLL